MNSKYIPHSHRVKKISLFRRLSIDGFDAVSGGHNITALLELDVTEARKKLRALKREGRRVSFFTFIVKSIALVVAEHKELNSIMGRRNIIEFDDVDVNFPIELSYGEEQTPRQLVIRNAARKSVEEIYTEIETAKEQHRTTGNIGEEDRWMLRMMKGFAFVPRFLRVAILKSLLRNPFTVKKNSGTIFITSVSVSTSGFIIPFMGGPRALFFALGSVFPKHVYIDGEMKKRDMFSMTVVFNHDIVDGQPAARFIKRLERVITSGEVLA